MTCAHFGRDQIYTQVKGSFSPLDHPTQVNASWVTSSNLLIATEIENSLPYNVFFVLLLACTCEETCESVWLPNASLYASSTCVLLRLLAGPFGRAKSLRRNSSLRRLKFLHFNCHSSWKCKGIYCLIKEIPHFLSKSGNFIESVLLIVLEGDVFFWSVKN